MCACLSACVRACVRARDRHADLTVAETWVQTLAARSIANVSGTETARDQDDGPSSFSSISSRSPERRARASMISESSRRFRPSFSKVLRVWHTCRKLPTRARRFFSFVQKTQGAWTAATRFVLRVRARAYIIFVCILRGYVIRLRKVCEFVCNIMHYR